MSNPREVFGHQQPTPLLRAALSFTNAALGTGLPIMRLDPDDLFAAAEKRTGLSDWGEGFAFTAFEGLVESARTDARLNFIGRYSLTQAVVTQLAGWLRLVDESKRNPEQLEQPVRKPIIIVGMPRTGTTLLHHMMAAHPDAMYLPLWLATRPLPAPSTREWLAGGSAERRRIATRSSQLMDRLIPSMKYIHPYDPDYPVECSYLIGPAFLSNQWGGWPLYSYLEWSMTADMAGGYACYKAHLQLLQATLPGDHWILKSPGHFIGLPALMEEMPDATFVLTHRDPAKVFPSLNSMIAAHHEVMSDDLDFQRTSDLMIDGFAVGARRYLELREENPGRFIDIRFSDLMADPVGAARGIYEAADVRWDAEVEQVLNKHLEDKAAESKHNHKYPMRQYGFSPESLRARFADYIDTLGIKTG